MKNFVEKMDKLVQSFTGNGTDDHADNRIVVSVTSYPARMHQLHIPLFSLLTQTLKPQKVVLWLAEEQFPNKEGDIPEKVLALEKNGLDIRWTKDVKSYKKLAPALREFGDRPIVTADDDFFYVPGWLAALYADCEANGFRRMIYTHRAHRILHNPEGGVLPYMQWYHLVPGDSKASLLHLATTGGGTLFLPGSLHPDAVQDDIFMQLAPTADDIFFWAMAVLNDTPTRVVANNILPEYAQIAPEADGLWIANTQQGKNDEQLRAVFDRYPSVKKKMLAAWKREREERVRIAEKQQRGFSSANYWEDRYHGGGNSGAGSYNHLMRYKADILNGFMEKNDVRSVIDFGVGDGSQLAALAVRDYIGFDVSRTVLDKVRRQFASDGGKTFLHTSEYAGHKAELGLSMDVIYHLVEDEVFHDYMARLFDASTRYVVIYSSNVETVYLESAHVKHRKFSRWIARERPAWRCIEYIKNKYPMRFAEDDYTQHSFSDFYIYEKSTDTEPGAL